MNFRKLSNTLINYLFGSREEFTLEHRFFNSVTLFAALAGMLATLTNLILGLHNLLTIYTSATCIVVSLFYYYSRRKGYYKYLLIPFLIFSLASLPVMWFLNAGSQGPVGYIYYLVLIIFIIITKGNIRIVTIWGFIVTLIILFSIERINPSLITYYENEEIKYWDVALTFAFSLLLLYFIISVLVRNYRDEKNISSEQRDDLIEKQKQITDSIMYASKIQNALLPREDQVTEVLQDYFVFYLPKDIVSGDFYWTKQVNNFKLIIVADCTGHGVPGAFMSVLGISILNDIVRRSDITQANQTLEVLRKELISALHQDSEDTKLKDGMDISLCVIDTEKNNVQYAGANNSMFLVRNKKVREFKGTRNPIGVSPNQIPFENNIIEVKDGDMIYMSTDGFMDQFGGEKGKKMKIRLFKQLLLELAPYKIETQKKIVTNFYFKWIGSEYEQVDDILLMGYKINLD